MKDELGAVTVRFIVPFSLGGPGIVSGVCTMLNENPVELVVTLVTLQAVVL